MVKNNEQQIPACRSPRETGATLKSLGVLMAERAAERSNCDCPSCTLLAAFYTFSAGVAAAMLHATEGEMGMMQETADFFRGLNDKYLPNGKKKG